MDIFKGKSESIRIVNKDIYIFPSEETYTSAKAKRIAISDIRSVDSSGNRIYIECGDWNYSSFRVDLFSSYDAAEFVKQIENAKYVSPLSFDNAYVYIKSASSAYSDRIALSEIKNVFAEPDNILVIMHGTPANLTRYLMQSAQHAQRAADEIKSMLSRRKSPYTSGRRSKSSVLAIILVVLVLAALFGRDNDDAGSNTNSVSSAETPLSEALSEIPTASASKKELSPILQAVQISRVEASSELNYGGKVFHASNIADGDISTSWQEAVPGNGIGESITVYFSEVYYISAIDFRLGNAKSEDAYFRNDRPRVLKITFSDGTCIEQEFEDINDTQTVKLSTPIASEFVEFVIVDSYKGSNMDEDTCISEISFYCKPETR